MRARVLLRFGIRFGILWPLLVLAAGLPVVAADGAKRDSPRGYRSSLQDAGKTRVLVLATPHLAQVAEPPSPEALAPLAEVLTVFRPAVVAVEQLPAEVLEDLERRGEPLAQVAGMFARRRLEAGRKVRQALGISRPEAHREARGLLRQGKELGPEERLRVVAHLLAALDYDTALLQWSYLPESARRSVASLPPDVVAQLEQDLISPNERISIASAVARRVGLQEITCFDDHFDAQVFFDLAERFPGELEKLEAHPESKAIGEAPLYARINLLFDAGRRDGAALLRYYQTINSPEFGAADRDLQWGRYLRTRLESKVDRGRLAQWETRNLRMAAHLRQVSALHPGGRILVVVGTSHKPFLDQYLAQMADVKIVHLPELQSGRQRRRGRGADPVPGRNR